MYCSKCGNQINENSVFCSKCGNEVVNTNKNLNIENVKGLHKKKSMFTALLLTIFSIAIPISIVLFTYVLSFSDKRYSPELWGDERNVIFYASIVIGCIGFLTYFINNIKIKRFFSFIYLGLSIINIAMLFLIAIGTVFFFLDLGGILFISPILQIISGSKFVVASKVYDE